MFLVFFAPKMKCEKISMNVCIAQMVRLLTYVTFYSYLVIEAFCDYITFLDWLVNVYMSLGRIIIMDGYSRGLYIACQWIASPFLWKKTSPNGAQSAGQTQGVSATLMKFRNLCKSKYIFWSLRCCKIIKLFSKFRYKYKWVFIR